MSVLQCEQGALTGLFPLKLNPARSKVIIALCTN